MFISLHHSTSDSWSVISESSSKYSLISSSEASMGVEQGLVVNLQAKHKHKATTLLNSRIIDKGNLPFKIAKFLILLMARYP